MKHDKARSADRIRDEIGMANMQQTYLSEDVWAELTITSPMFNNYTKVKQKEPLPHLTSREISEGGLSVGGQDYRPRLSVEITTEQQLALQKWLDYGIQKRLFSIIVDDVIRMLESNAGDFLAAVQLRLIEYKDYTSLELKDGNPK